jgi:hypothetical protein
MQDLIAEARKLATAEIERYGAPPLPNFEIANKQGQILAERFNLDKDIVMLGTLLMDLKLGECLKEGKLDEHIDRSIAAANEFLTKHHIPEGKKRKILNCVACHHATRPFECEEAEIVANADCYKFLHPYGIFVYFAILGERGGDPKKIIEQVEFKVDEKWNALTLDDCKKELELTYRDFKKYIKQAKSF